jgi:uncharacterized RmlC-like cupin family protein
MTECRLIRGGASFHGKQGLDYFSGVSAESTGAKAICMHLLEMPPGSTAKPHYHEAHETAIFVLEGMAEMRHGSNLEHVMRVEAGDFVYIPAGVPHQPYNPEARPVRAVIARTDPMSRKASSCSRSGRRARTIDVRRFREEVADAAECLIRRMYPRRP